MFRRLTKKFDEWRRYRQAVRELSMMSDRELNDLGIARADIDVLVRQGSRAAA